MNKEYIMIADKEYYTSKEEINNICLLSGFDRVSYKNQNIKGRFKKGYLLATFKHSFRCFADKVEASKIVKLELDKLEVL